MKTKETKSREMNRRDFIRVSSVGATAATLSFSMISTDTLFAFSNVADKNSKDHQKQVKKDLFKYACSGSLFLHVNRCNDHPKEELAPSVATLSGGIAQKGYQCGMLWGASLAAGAESYRRFKNSNHAVAGAITASENIVQSFYERTNCVNCRDITNTEWSNKGSILKYMITGKMFKCLNIAKKWAPEAQQSSDKGLKNSAKDLPVHTVSCATEVARKMGVEKEKTIMVAGLAGGIGLSGNACGALGAAVWLKSIAWMKENPDSRDIYNPYAKRTIEAFEQETGSKFLCKEICGRPFISQKDHTGFIDKGGCSKLINVLAQA